MGPDPTTGLLTRRFTVYYGVGDWVENSLSVSYNEGPLGIVRVEDPIETLQVRQFINTHTHTHAHTPSIHPSISCKHSNASLSGLDVHVVQVKKNIPKIDIDPLLVVVQNLTKQDSDTVWALGMLWLPILLTALVDKASHIQIQLWYRIGT